VASVATRSDNHKGNQSTCANKEGTTDYTPILRPARVQAVARDIMTALPADFQRRNEQPEGCLTIMLREGYQYGAGFGTAAILVGALTTPLWALPLVAVGLFTMYFFRDPGRTIPSDPGIAVSPADGKVMEVRPLDGGRNRISIFLSPLNVHVNRSPVAGTVKHVEYSPGRFHAAWKEEASIENERNTITVATAGGDVVFKQIAGALARRVVCWKHDGQPVERGERIGLMKFSSRMDVFLDASWKIQVSAGQRVEGGVTVIARQVDRQQNSGVHLRNEA
jgi:phosphatidylserine decarboxylase